jgi:hypothetical protein
VAERPLARRALRWLAIVLASAALAVGGILLLLAFFGSRDRSNVVLPGSLPGLLMPDRGDRLLPPGTLQRTRRGTPPTSGPHAVAPVAGDGVELTDDQLLTALALGNVVVLYPRDPLPPALRRLQLTVAGGRTSEPLVASGQAVVLARRSGVTGIYALAWRRLLHVRGADDARLAAFAGYWLGRGARAARPR